MFRVAIKSLLGHKLRFALTTLAVVIGVTFVAGTFILTDSMDDAFTDLLEVAYETADVAVRAPNEVSGFTAQVPGEGPSLDADLLDTVAAVDGVAEVAAFVEGSATFVGRDGEPLGSPGAPMMAFSWSDRLTPLTLKSGRAATAPDEVMMDAGTAEAGGFAVGDEVRVILPDDVRMFEVVGITGFGESDNLLGASIASFELTTAQALFGKEGEVDEISVAAAEGVEATVLRDRIAAELGAGAEVTTTADQIAAAQDDVRTALGFITTAILAFAAVALFVGSFIVVNTFSIVVAQRTREFALLRAVGASARQVRAAVLIEAAAVGVVSSLAGLALGVGFASVLAAAMSGFGVDLPTGDPVIAPRTVIASFAVGLVVTLVAALGAARRAGKVAPVEAMRAGATAETRPLRRRIAIGVAVAVVGVALLLVGLVGSGGSALSLVGAGALVTMLGVALVSPLLARPLAAVVGGLPARLGVSGRLAQRNAASNPRRTATTASALMIGLTLVAFVTIFAASIRGAVADTLNEQFRADFIVSTELPGLQNLPTGLRTDLAARDELAEVTGVALSRFVEGEEGDLRFVAGVDPGTITDVVALDVDGDLDALAGDAMLVERSTLDDRGLAVGDVLTLTFLDAADVDITIAGTVEGTDLIGAGYLMGRETLDRLAGGVSDAVVYANAAGDVAAARTVLDDVVAAYPGANARDQAEFRAEQEDQVNQILGLMMVLLALAVIVALLGIANTLALSIFERTREIGLLRAVGMTRRQARRMITWESVIVAVFGAVLGLGVGTFFGWAVVRAVEDVGRLVVPGGQLSVYLVAAGLAGVLAALFPARRAARLDVLEAVTTE